MATKGSLGVLGLEEQTNAGPSVQSGGTIDSGTTQAVTQRGTITDFKSEEVNVEQSETVTPTTEKVNDEQKATPGVLGTGSYYADTAPLTSSWENKAEQQSGIKFQQDVLAGKQTMLRSAQEAQAKGQEMQTQLALGEYMRGQSTEKAGWTGGYMLDQKRQGDYLKASIQAQMYGAQELQRYGMDTQLEAARLAYDLGKEQLAYQLYQQEYQKSITEAQMFGYYVSPENRDLLNQLRASQAVLSDVNATEEEKARATVVKNQIDTWFGEQNLDPNDISKFAEITMEREQWNQAKLDAVLATINDDPSTFIARNPDGSYATDPATGQYLKLNFDDISSSDLATFLSKDDGSDNKFADATFRSYAKYLAQSTINDYFSSLGEGVAPTAEGFKTYLATAGADKLQAFRDKNPSLKATIDAILASNFSPTLTRDGVTISYGGPVSGAPSEEEPGSEEPDSDTPVTEDGLTPTEIIQTYEDPEAPALEIDSIDTQTIEGGKEFTYTNQPETNWILNNNLFDGAVYIKKESKYLFDTGFFKDGDVVKIPKYDRSIAQTGNILGYTYGILKDGKLHEIDVNKVPGADKDAYFGNRLKDLGNILTNRKALLDHEASIASTKKTESKDITSSYIFNFLNNSNITNSNKKSYMDGISKVVAAALNGTLKEGSYITFGNSTKALYYKDGKFHEITNFTISNPAGTAQERKDREERNLAMGIYTNWGPGVGNLITSTDLTNTIEGENRF